MPPPRQQLHCCVQLWHLSPLQPLPLHCRRGVSALQANCSSSDTNNPLIGAGTVAYLSPGKRNTARASAPLPPAAQPAPELRCRLPCAAAAVPCGKFFRFTWWITW